MSDVRVDPSKLHLKKELTAIRKAARVLRDPGTSSSWRSPLSSSARSVAAASSSWKPMGNETTRGNNGNSGLLHLPFRRENEHEENKKVVLYNWRHPQSSRNKIKPRLDDGVQRFGQETEQEEGSSGSPEDSLSDTHHNKEVSKSDTYPIMVFRARDTKTGLMGTPPARRTTARRKSKKNTIPAIAVGVSRPQQPHQQIVFGRNSANSKRSTGDLPSIPLGLEGRNTVSLVEQSDDTEEFSNSEELRWQASAASPLLSRLRRGNWSHSSKLSRSIRREDDSCSYSTPAASTSSYHRYGNRNPSTVGSWDGTTTSFNDGDDEVEDHLDLPGRQGCGIPCYWAKRTPKHRMGCGGCYSPSLSDTLRRKGSRMLCGSQTIYHRRRRSSLGSNKRKSVSRSAQGLLPLLTTNSNSCDGRGGSSVGTGRSDDELSTNFGELDLEALSRLDGRRWSSSCRSQEGLELVALTGGGAAEEGRPEHIRSPSQKYRPRFFDELIGQSIVVHSLTNAISRGRIAPVYLFQGPRGTGKTSAARIFASALNCLATEESKPCGFCRKCTEFFAGKGMDLCEVDATNKRGIDRVRYLLKNMSMMRPSSFSRYKVFVIDECHLLPSKTWSIFLKFLEEPPPRVVFIFITTDLDNVPRPVVSRCQKYLFNKLKDSDIVTRLKKISIDESLDVEPDALDQIALNADGSLRDAETMLDQLSLLGKRITKSLVNELVGVVSDEKLLDLLELAMSSDTAETVKRARELIDSGVDPIALMSQLAGLIMDIIAGTYHLVDAKCNGSFFGGRSLTEAELERLKQALKLLLEAEKQLRVSCERSTWFTAALLQLGSISSSDPSHSSSSRRQISKTSEDDPSGTPRELLAKSKSDALIIPHKSTSALMPKAVNGHSSSQGDPLSVFDSFSINSRLKQRQFVECGASASSHNNLMAGNRVLRCMSPDTLDDIWEQCIQKCHSKTLRQLLSAHGKLVSISEAEGRLIMFIAFEDGGIKSRAERFLRSITDSIEIVLRHDVEVRIGLMPDGKPYINSAAQVDLPGPLAQKQTDTTEAGEREREVDSNTVMNVYSDVNALQEPLKLSRDSFNGSEGIQQAGTLNQSKCSPLPSGSFNATTGLPVLLVEEQTRTSGMKDRTQEIPMQRIHEIIDEQRLETAWLQVAEKGTPGSRLKLERNQVLPQDDIYRQNQVASMSLMSVSSQHWENELNHEIEALKINNGRGQQDQIHKRIDHYPMSPSLLHDGSYVGSFSKELLGYESESGHGGCNGIFCWKTTKQYNRGKVNKGTPVRPKGGRFLWLGQCGKSRKLENRIR